MLFQPRWGFWASLIVWASLGACSFQFPKAVGQLTVDASFEGGAALHVRQFEGDATLLDTEVWRMRTALSEQDLPVQRSQTYETFPGYGLSEVEIHTIVAWIEDAEGNVLARGATAFKAPGCGPYCKIGEPCFCGVVEGVDVTLE